MYIVLSDRLPFPRGTQVSEEQLTGCNVDALIKGGHLGLVVPPPEPPAAPEAPPVPDTPPAPPATPEGAN